MALLLGPDPAVTISNRISLSIAGPTAVDLASLHSAVSPAND
jgi:hypothetical protein